MTGQSPSWDILGSVYEVSSTCVFKSHADENICVHLFKTPSHTWLAPTAWREAKPGWAVDVEGFDVRSKQVFATPTVLHRERWFPDYDTALAEYLSMLDYFTKLTDAEGSYLLSLGVADSRRMI